MMVRAWAVFDPIINGLREERYFDEDVARMMVFMFAEGARVVEIEYDDATGLTIWSQY